MFIVSRINTSNLIDNELQDLVTSKQLRMNIYNHISIFSHVAVAIRLSNSKRVSRSDNIEYVYTDSLHQNPLSRVVFGNSTTCKEPIKNLIIEYPSS